MEIPSSSNFLDTISSWTGDESSWSAFAIRVGTPALAQIASAVTVSCYDPEHQSMIDFNGSISENQSLLKANILNTPYYPIVHGLGSWTGDLCTNLNITEYTLTRSYCNDLPTHLQDPSLLVYLVSFVTFSLSTLAVYDDLGDTVWRRITSPAVLIGSAIAFWASLLTSNTVNVHSLVSLVPPTLTTIMVSVNLARATFVLYQKSRLKKWPLHEGIPIAIRASIFASFLLVVTLLSRIWAERRS